MARFVATVDLWDAATREALEAGRLTLQPGQWAKCGDGLRSRFYRINRATGHIVAFHGPNASRKLRQYVQNGKAAAARLEAARAARS